MEGFKTSPSRNRCRRKLDQLPSSQPGRYEASREPLDCRNDWRFNDSSFSSAVEELCFAYLILSTDRRTDSTATSTFFSIEGTSSRSICGTISLEFLQRFAMAWDPRGIRRRRQWSISRRRIGRNYRSLRRRRFRDLDSRDST